MSSLLKHKFATRAFLNMPEEVSPAAIICTINRGHFYIDITDCTGSVHLHGYLGKKERYENAYHKIDTLISHLQALRAEIQQTEKYHKKKAPKILTA